MSNKKITSKLCVLIAAAMLVSGNARVNRVYADNANPLSKLEALTRAAELYENLSKREIELPAELSGGDSGFLKAVKLGCANMEEKEESAKETIAKQDFMTILYKAIINYDPSYALNDEETDQILNECYDNAYIRDENRAAYAFMLKQGIISVNHGSQPDKITTEESCEILINLICDYFSQDVVITVGDTDITIGSNVDELIEEIGEPDRVDETEYGFQWYVYNSGAEFFMVGVEGSRICALFTNGSFAYETIESGCDFEETKRYADNANLRFISDGDGKVDALLYNPRARGEQNDAEIRTAKSAELIDMINARRGKNLKTSYVSDEDLTSAAWVAAENHLDGAGVTEDAEIYCDYDVYFVYEAMMARESDILSEDFRFTSPIGVYTEFCEDDAMYMSIVSDETAVAPVFKPIETEEPEETEAPTETPAADMEITTPVIISPTENDEFDEGDDLVIELEEQAAAKYHIEVFDVEKDDYAVNEYIITNDTEIAIPSELFSLGVDYRLTVSAVAEDGTALSSEEMEISYGSAYETGVKIVAPIDNTVTDDDSVNLTWKSDEYNDFEIDLYNENDELVVNTIVKGEHEALIRGLDPGKYCAYVTALKRGTRIEKAQSYVFFTIENAIPVIDEIVLEPEDTYYFVYEDETMGVLYLYDKEIVTINGKKRKKIIRKQVKDTKAYRKLAQRQDKAEFTTGEPTLTRRKVAVTAYSADIGEAIVAEAEKYLGVDYVWGGETPSGFDCSGLVQYCLNTLGISISRVAEDQFEDGTPVSRDELQPGDLVFFEQNGYIHHVGIYAGDGMMIHAPHTGETVQYQSLDTEYYRNGYAGARRVY